MFRLRRLSQQRNDEIEAECADYRELMKAHHEGLFSFLKRSQQGRQVNLDYTQHLLGLFVPTSIVQGLNEPLINNENCDNSNGVHGPILPQELTNRPALAQEWVFDPVQDLRPLPMGIDAARSPPGWLESTSRTAQSSFGSGITVQDEIKPGERRKARKSPKHKDWLTHKPEIIRLYIDEEEELDAVIAIMKCKGFDASRAQYKLKFKQWDLSKRSGAGGKHDDNTTDSKSLNVLADAAVMTQLPPSSASASGRATPSLSCEVEDILNDPCPDPAKTRRCVQEIFARHESDFIHITRIIKKHRELYGEAPANSADLLQPQNLSMKL